jgi:peptidoglycan/xylan/chitin deacetylase (PgdA/CDA1 family)
MDPRYGANVKAAYAKGHQIGNHGWNHLSSTDCATMNPNECPNGDLTNPQVYNQIKSLNDVLFNIIGKVPNFFRYFLESYLIIFKLIQIDHLMDNSILILLIHKDSHLMLVLIQSGKNKKKFDLKKYH